MDRKILTTTAITLTLATGVILAVDYEGIKTDIKDIPSTNTIKIESRAKDVLEFRVGDYTYRFNSQEDLETFAYGKDEDDDENTIFARKIIKESLKTETIDKVVDSLSTPKEAVLNEEVIIDDVIKPN